MFRTVLIIDNLVDVPCKQRSVPSLRAPDWYQFCVLLVQRPVYTKSHPRRSISRITRKLWRTMTEEEKQKLKARIEDMHEKFMRAMKDMPRGMLMIFRWGTMKDMPCGMLLIFRWFQ